MAERAARARSAHSMAMAMLTPCILAFTAPLQDASSIASATFSTAYSLYLLIGGSFRVCRLAALLDPGERGHNRPLRHLVGQVLLHDPLCGLHLLQFLCDLLHQILCGHGSISLITKRVHPVGFTCLRVFNFSCVTIRRCTWSSS